MTQQELIKLLTLIYHTGGVNPYWKNKLRNVLQQAGVSQDALAQDEN